MPDNGGMRRRRECRKCAKRFTTFERVGNLDLKVVKKDGRIECFDREKVVRGVKKACWKRPVTPEAMEELVDDIELKLLNRATTKIPSGDIGKMLALDNRWAFNIIKQVGNYGESFEANLKPLGFERGLNAQWKDGGLMYAPPIR